MEEIRQQLLMNKHHLQEGDYFFTLASEPRKFEHYHSHTYPRLHLPRVPGPWVCPGLGPPHSSDTFLAPSAIEIMHLLSC